AIVGRSGSGKTTLFNLLLRFYKASSGKITIDGIDIEELEENSLRQYISVVRQDPFLFSLSIKDNLRLVKPNATKEEIETVCKTAFIHDFITKLPQGYDTVVGDNAVTLSGGQKQRIAIARALLRNSKIILFDEATSALDNESQYKIKESIDEISKSHTVIIIAHRLLTVVQADEILLMDEGKLIGRGTHRKLLESNDLYKKLYKMELDIISEESY
ncbi:MAG TPA: ATP-binding cassette domain-containing protein, partial [Clostridia bacterium]